MMAYRGLGHTVGGDMDKLESAGFYQSINQIRAFQTFNGLSKSILSAFPELWLADRKLSALRYKMSWRPFRAFPSKRHV
jgi:thymidine phosphorylase